MFLKKEDYSEPCCPFEKPNTTARIPVSRVLDKLDTLLDQKDYLSAERHLATWLSEAEFCRDQQGKLTIHNEQIGLYRKLGKKDEALRSAQQALEFSSLPEFENTILYATTLINAATAYKAFGKSAEAVPLFRKARILYEAKLFPDDRRLAGLYNNMALALTDLRETKEAKELFEKALTLLSQTEHGEGEMAVTCCNLADLTAAACGTEGGEEQISKYLEAAENYLNTETLPHDGTYAFLCEKCAPTFGYYGFFFTEKELMRRAKEYYDRS